MSFSRITIIGAGVMGQGIARTVAATGIDVLVVDKTLEKLRNGIECMTEDMDADIRRWGLTEAEKKAILARVQTSENLENLKGSDLVIECIEEDFSKKRKLFSHIDKIAPKDCIFITNTSTLSVTELAAATRRTKEFIGLHFLHPVHKIPVVELVRGLYTSEETFEKITIFIREIGKTPVQVYEYPGYITTRVILPMLNEAMKVLM
ncbi:NAD(P)-binding domain-containing protein, partial [bacterium]|nr:NAD(P)-binding domain-containing protein [bacterium]